MTPAWALRQEELLSDCVVSPDVFTHVVKRLRDVVVPYQQTLATEAGKRNVHLYLEGLLSHLPRKNAEEIAALVDVERLVMQDFMGTAPWDHRPLVKVLVGEVVNRLGEPDGIIAFDPSSFPKRGTHSVGVKRQWCGHRGKVDNCQVGVYMGYVSRDDHALLDFRTTVRDLEVPLPAYQGRGRRPKAPWQSVSAWRQAFTSDAWTRLTVRDGEKGPVGIEMIKRRVQTRLQRKRTGPEEWLVVTRRPLADDRTSEGKSSLDATEPDDRYRYYLTPTAVSRTEREEPSLAELARVIKAGLGMEASFQRGKGEAGMDEYQVRTWQGWHHHMALSLISVWFLIRETHLGQQVTPALTLPQVRYGLSVLLMEVVCTLSVPSICRQVQRQLMRNELARFYHHRTRKCLPPKKLRRAIQ
jgi:SRSO17 transposase